MKKYSSIAFIFGLASVCLIAAGCATNQTGAAAAPPNSGHVLIYRVANFGADMALVVSVDGKDVGSFSEGANYSGYLPAGQHRLAVRAEPNRGGVGPGKTTVNVQAGQTYSYTAVWASGNLKLVKNP